MDKRVAYVVSFVYSTYDGNVTVDVPVHHGNDALLRSIENRGATSRLHNK